MRTFFILFILFVLGQNNSQGQTCLSGFNILATQNQIDSFPINYPNCNTIEGDIQLGEFGTDITNFDSLYQLQSIAGDLVIFYTQGMEDLWGLQNLESVEGSLNIKNNSVISLTGLEKLSDIGNDLVINNNDSLINLIGLEKITSIGNEFFIFENDKLENLIGLENLTLTSGLRIHNNLVLQNFEGLNNLKKIHGSFDIVSNDALSNFIGLENLDSIFGNVFIQVNHQLVNLEGLNNLKFAGKNFSIIANHKLESLTALENLVHVEGPGLKITDHPILKSLEGINNIEMSDLTTVSNLNLEYNDSLSFCGVQSVCDYIQNGGIHFLTDNEFGCNDSSQILVDCNITSSEDLQNFGLKIFPNPANSYFELSKLESIDQSYSLKILDSYGRVLFEKQLENFNSKTPIEISSLHNGIYLIIIQPKDLKRIPIIKKLIVSK